MCVIKEEGWLIRGLSPTPGDGIGFRCWSRELWEAPGLEDRYRMPCRGVVLEKWLGGTDKQKVGEEWPGPVKCVYTLRD